MRRVLLILVAVLAACNIERRHVVGPDSHVAAVLVAPDTLTIDPLGTWQFGVFGRTETGDSVPVSVQWTASAGQISNGLYFADSTEEDVTITATTIVPSGTTPLSGSATVRKRRIIRILLTPDGVTLFPGQTQQFIARGVRNSGDTVTASVTYAATGGAVSSSGLFTAGPVSGNFRVIATRRGVADTAVVTIVNAPVATVTVAPSAPSLAVGGTVQLTATTRDAAGNVLTGRSITWSSSAPAVATVSANGVVSAVATGSATITATSEGQSGTADVTVSTVPVATVTVAPATAGVAVGGTSQLSATTKDAAGNVLTGRSITWSSSNPAVATVSASGLVTGVAAGSATITATSEGQNGTSTITVTIVPVATVTVAPATALLRIGTTVQLTATTKDGSGNVLTGRSITWSSSAAGVATVSANGLVTAVAAGSATITATSEGKSGTSTITVTIVPVATVTVTPASSNLSIAGTVVLTAVTKDSAGNVLTGRSVTWSSNATGVATVSVGGLVTAIGAGSATITATSEGKNGTAGITVAGTVTHSGRYVTTSGTSGGDGTSARPWDLRTALSGASGRILAGDTVWIRGGRYLGSFVSTLRGGSGNPIIVRAYPGERAIIDGTPSSAETFTIDGTWTVFWGLELTNTILERFNQRPAGIYFRNTSHVKVINFVVHDVGMGTYTESAAQDVEIYGSIYYNNGNQDATRSNGHGVYIKNEYTTPKVAADNIFFNMFGHGLHSYTNAGDGFLENVVVRGNVSFNNGTLSNYPNANILMGGDEPVTNGLITDNMTYFSPGLGFRNLRLGYGTITNPSVTVRNNYLVGGSQTLEANIFTTAEVSGNTIIGSGTMVMFAGSSGSGWTWAANHQVRDPNAQAWKRGSTALTFSAWETATGLGATDQVSAAAPTTPAIFVRPNLYEPGRANVIVYNWGRQSAVSIDLSNVLAVGQRYEIRNVQDLFGTPVVSGVYGGGSVSLPMGGVAPPQPVGGSPVAPVRTGPDFDVFIVVPL